MRATAVTLARGGATPSAASFRQDDGRIFIPLPPALRASDTLRATVTYDGTPDDGLIIRDNVHGQRGAFADNWPDRARFWFPAIDHPSGKATVDYAVRAPSGWQVVANGVRVDAQMNCTAVLRMMRYRPLMGCGAGGRRNQYRRT